MMKSTQILKLTKKFQSRSVKKIGIHTHIYIYRLQMHMYVYLAGTAFDDDVTVLTDGTGLLRVGFGGSGVGLGLEVVLFVRHVYPPLSLSLEVAEKFTDSSERKQIEERE